VLPVAVGTGVSVMSGVHCALPALPRLSTLIHVTSGRVGNAVLSALSLVFVIRPSRSRRPERDSQGFQAARVRHGGRNGGLVVLEVVVMDIRVKGQFWMFVPRGDLCQMIAELYSLGWYRFDHPVDETIRDLMLAGY